MSVYAWVALGFVVWVAVACLIVIFMQIADRPAPPMFTDDELDRWRR